MMAWKLKGVATNQTQQINASFCVHDDEDWGVHNIDPRCCIDCARMFMDPAGQLEALRYGVTDVHVRLVGHSWEYNYSETYRVENDEMLDTLVVELTSPEFNNNWTIRRLGGFQLWGSPVQFSPDGDIVVDKPHCIAWGIDTWTEASGLGRAFAARCAPDQN